MSLYEADLVRIEKEKAMRRYNRFYHVVGILRSLELCVAFTLLSWSVSRFSPSSSSAAAIAALAYYVRLTTIFCGDLIRRIFFLFLCPHFVFFIGNAVIVTLLLHSARDSGSHATSGSPELEPEDSSDFGPIVALAEPETTPSSDEAEQSPAVKVRTGLADVDADQPKDTFEIRRSEMEPRPEKDIHDGTEAEARVNFLLLKTDESLTGSEESASSEEGEMIRLLSDTEPHLETEIFDDRKVTVPVEERVRFRRSETELCRKTWSYDYGEEVSTVKERMKLRRSDTDLFQRTESQGDDVEDLSSEEFKKKVEAFIARHQRFMRQESLSVAF